MRGLAIVAVMFASVCIVWARGDSEADKSQAEARAVVGKAIKAMGLEGVKLPKGIRMKSKATIEYPVFDKDIEFATVKVDQTITIRLPNQFKEVYEMSTLGETAGGLTIFDGKQGWLTHNGKVSDMEEKGCDDYRELANVIEATHLITPLLDKKYKLALLDEANVDGRLATGIRAFREGFADLDLYFDKETYMLLKMERQGLDPVVAAQCQETRIYKGHRKINGRMVPASMELLRDGRQIFNFQIVDYTFLNDVDPREFDRPKQ